ncbi:LysM peptidoglycan-binding domain-containing protein [Paenibacillus terrigena]|uniref:LysM peptidoglycan-binding domain-containing protein n=1 Tax=Paenibacillus terrigena TaxID=369333 RepID=UPI0028D8C7F1|nr:LysM peptidoglycan-binding domain-containing protein [Paenibacillus terrigena]
MLKYSSYQSVYNNRSEVVNRDSFLKKKVVQVVLFLVLVCSLTSMGLLNAFAADTHNGEHNANIPLQIVVSSGDTLWAIAKEHKPAGMDVRTYIEMIKDLNGKRSSSIQSGEVIKLPIL